MSGEYIIVGVCASGLDVVTAITAVSTDVVRFDIDGKFLVVVMLLLLLLNIVLLFVGVVEEVVIMMPVVTEEFMLFSMTIFDCRRLFDNLTDVIMLLL